jgi:hypothetical protein
MLNSQHRIAPQKNIANAQEPTVIFFCVAAVPKDSQRFPKRCASTTFFYALSLRSVKGRACGSMAKEQLQKWHSKGIAASQRTGASQKTTA